MKYTVVMCYKKAILCLHVQMTLIHWFPGKTVLKISMEMILIDLQYQLMFLLNEHMVSALSYSLTRNLLCKVCLAVDTQALLILCKFENAVSLICSQLIKTHFEQCDFTQK
jgi:hypothetical protein